MDQTIQFNQGHRQGHNFLSNQTALECIWIGPPALFGHKYLPKTGPGHFDMLYLCIFILIAMFFWFSCTSYETARKLRFAVIHGLARMAAIMAATYKAYLGVGLGPLSVRVLYMFPDIMDLLIFS